MHTSILSILLIYDPESPQSSTHFSNVSPYDLRLFNVGCNPKQDKKKKKKEKKLRVDLGVKTGKTVTSSMAGLGLGPRQLTTGYTLAIS